MISNFDAKSLTLTPAAARRFLRQAHGLNGWQSFSHVADALNHLEFVQEDSINICGRIHDLILWARVQAYCPSDLQATLYTPPRQAFEYYFPNLCALPLRDLPYFLRRMLHREAAEGRWGTLTPEEWPVAQEIYQHLDRESFLHVREASAEHGHATSGWGTRQKLATRVLEKMWLQGRLMLHSRDDFTRRYALAEHVLKESADAHDLPPVWFDRTTARAQAAISLPTHEEEQAYLTRKARRARRLFRLKKGDIETLGASSFVRVEIEGEKRPWYALAEDFDALQSAQIAPPPDPTVFFLAPLDPLVYDRERNRALFDFDYTWEVYTPAVKRKWGYYVLPILCGDRLVGRLDPKADRKAGILRIMSLRLESGVEEGEVGPGIAARLADYARFLGMKEMVWEKGAIPSAPLERRVKQAV